MNGGRHGQEGSDGQGLPDRREPEWLRAMAIMVVRAAPDLTVAPFADADGQHPYHQSRLNQPFGPR